MQITTLGTKDIRQFQKQLLRWFSHNQRPMPWRNIADPFATWVSEVMLQQTRVETVIPYFNRFMETFPTPKHLARADLNRVLKQWEGLGYYARARNLQKAAQIVVQNHGGLVPNTPQLFLTLPGVGPYICAAVQSIAFGHPMAAVDGNVKRVLARLLLNKAATNAPDSHPIYQPLANSLLNQKHPGDHNQAMMELGAQICSPNPDCTHCPVAMHCAAHRTQRVQEYPIRIAKKSIPTRNIAVGIIRKKDRLLICRRKEDGLLGGLWEFPGGGVEQGESSKHACIREIQEEVNLQVAVESKFTTITHGYTHFKIDMDVFLCRYKTGRVRLNGPVDFGWVKPSDLAKYAFPKANNKFIPMLLAHLAKENRQSKK